MLSVNSNYGSQFAAKAAKNTQALMDKSVERLSTGKRINSAKDDTAGIAIATRLNAEIQGLAAASRKAADAQSLVDTMEGAIQETHKLLLRMRELAVQASNGTLSTSDNLSLDTELTQLSNEIHRIARETTWGGTDILNPHHHGYTSITFKFNIDSIEVSNPLELYIGSVSGDGLGIRPDLITLSNATNARSTISKIDGAISAISEKRGKLGTMSNRLEHSIANLDQIRVNLSASKGRIEDADFAVETGNLAKSQILQQAAIAMLAQANASKRSILTLVRLE